MAGRLSGRVAIVTGGGQGVGLGIAQVFLREGARVLITGRTPDKLEAAVAGLAADGGEAAWIAGTAGVRADAEGGSPPTPGNLAATPVGAHQGATGFRR